MTKIVETFTLYEDENYRKFKYLNELYEELERL